MLCTDGVLIETSQVNDDLLPKLSELGFDLDFCTKPMDKAFKSECISESLIFDLHRPEFTTGLLSDFFKISFDNFIYKDNKIYFFNDFENYLKFAIYLSAFEKVSILGLNWGRSKRSSNRPPPLSTPHAYKLL